MSRLRAVAAAVLGHLDSPAGIFLAGWALIVAGVARESVSAALVTGGSLLIGVVIVGALKA